MNKKLMALAVASACVAPSVMAQSANPVTLYGRIYGMIESVKAKGDATASSNRLRVSDGSSYLGVRGTEDLGGGMKAFFQLETGFPVDTSTSSFGTRNSAVGLQGGWGSVLVGRWDSPYKVLGYGVDLWGDLTIAGITSAMHDRGNFDRRESNVVQYWTPNWGGFSAKISQTANEGKSATLNPSNSAFNVMYAKGPIKVAYGYEKHKDVSATIRKEEGNEIIGEFTLSSFKFGLMYEDIKKDTLTKQKNWLASVKWTLGKHQLGYQYQNSQDGGSNAPGVAQPECDVNSVGYFYNWSKRSQFVALYTDVKNNATGLCRFGAGALGASGSGSDPQGFAVGVKHVF